MTKKRKPAGERLVKVRRLSTENRIAVTAKQQADALLAIVRASPATTQHHLHDIPPHPHAHPEGEPWAQRWRK